MGSSWLWAAAVVFAGVAVWLARRLGLNPVFWGALAFFFGPVALPFLLLAGCWRRRRG